MDLGEPGPLTRVLLPAGKHQSVQWGGAVPGRRQPEAILHGLDHLGRGGSGGVVGRQEVLGPPVHTLTPSPGRLKWWPGRDWKQTVKKGLGLGGQGFMGRGQGAGA